MLEQVQVSKKKNIEASLLIVPMVAWAYKTNEDVNGRNSFSTLIAFTKVVMQVFMLQEIEM